jgi:uncharacterized phage protein gp47/JayE
VYESQTYEAILQRMLERVSSDIDKREGSIIHTALAPIAAELAQAYVDLDTFVNLTFARTSDGEFLAYRTAESGVNRRLATPAIRRGVFDAPVPIGSRFRGGDVVYVVREQIAGNEYRLEAETPGAIGNVYFGSLLPIEYIEGLTTATLADVLIPGEDEESDEALYQRYLEEINATRYGGNVDQYREWISAIPGVGRFRVQPLWNGRGTVRAIVTDANNMPPSAELVQLVQNTLDPEQDGMGTGLVPIGHVFTAFGATPKTVSVTMTVVFEEGYGPSDIEQEAEQIISGYFSEINFENPNFVQTTIRQSVILSRLIGIAAVRDILSLTLNGVDGNITLAADEVAKLGTVTINVAV